MTKSKIVSPRVTTPNTEQPETRPSALPLGATQDDPAAWRLAFRLVELICGNGKHFVRVLTLVLVIAATLIGLTVAAGPWATGFALATVGAKRIRGRCRHA